MICYKLVRKLRDGSLSPLFINKKLRLPFNVWLNSEFHPTRGFAVRQGWHCTLKPIAPHLKEQLASGEGRVWVKCEVQDYEYFERPEKQGGIWLLAQKIKFLGVL
jgi:hypothetical protein